MAKDLFPAAPTLAPEEITEVRDANTKTYINLDGSFSRDIYMAPIHWRDDAGNWQEINNDFVLERDKDGYDFHNASNAFKVKLAEKTDRGKQFSLYIGGKKLSLNLVGQGGSDYQGKDKGKGSQEASGDRASTDTEAPSLDKAPTSIGGIAKNRGGYQVTDLVGLEYIVTSVAVEQMLILSSSEAPNSFNFSLAMEGMDAKKDERGFIRFYSQDDGSELFSITPPVMKDSKVDSASGDSACSFDVSMDITHDAKGKANLTLTADPAWLTDPARVYPVYIDPAIKDIFPIYEGQSQFLRGDAYASSAYPNSNFGADWDPSHGFYQLKTGYYDSSTGQNRSAIGFDVRSFFHFSGDDPTGANYNWGATITSSTFYAYCYHSYYPTTPTQTWLYYATTDWGEDTLTWNNFPDVSYIANGMFCEGTWFACDATAATQSWVQGEENGGWRNRGFVLDANGNTSSSYWKKFSSWENGTDYAPRLRVNYTMVGATTNTDEIPVKMKNSDIRSANLFIRNTGEETWQCKGTNSTNPVQVEAYFTDRSGGNRQASTYVDLPRDVKQWETISVSVPITAPASGTDWRINFDMRKKDVYTFSSRGCNPAQVDITLASAYPADAERDASARLGRLPWMSYAPFSLGKVSGTMNANLITGNATCSYTDLSVSGRGVPFSINRTYNSLAPTRTTLFGPNWFSNLDVKVVEYTNPSGFLAFYDAQGTSYLLVQGKKDNTFVSPEGAYFKAEKNPNYTNPGDPDDNKNWKYKVTDTSGVVICFDAAGKLLYFADASKQTDVTGKLNYKNKTKVVYSSNYPSQIIDASGRTFTIVTSGGKITSASEDASWASGGDHEPRTVSYLYAGEGGRLSQATLTPGNHFLQYTYSGGNIMQVTEKVDDIGTTSTCYLAYDASNRLASFRDARSANSSDVTYKTAVIYGSGFTQLESPTLTSNVPGYTAHGIKVRYYLDAVGHCTTKYAGEGWLERVDYAWNGCHQNTCVTNYGTNISTPLGSTYYTYDGKGNVSRVEDDLNSSEKAVTTSDHSTSSNNSENTTQVTTPDGNTASAEYNAGENYFKTVDKAGAQTVTLRQSSSEVERESVTLPSNYVNLFQNPSFEKGTGTVADGWFYGGEATGKAYSIQSVTDGSAPAGKRFQRLSVSGNTCTGSTYIWQQAAVSASTDYTLAFSYRNNSCVNQQNIIIIRQFNSSNAQVGTDIVITPFRYTEWNRISKPFKTEATAASVRVYLRTLITATGQTTYTDFDAVHLYQGSRDTSFNYVENANFERDLGTSNWTVNSGNVTRSTDRKMSPGNSLKIASTGNVTQNINAKPNRRYLITGYVWSEGEASQYQGAAVFYSCENGGSGSLYDQSGTGYYDAGTQYITKTGKWVRVYGVVTTSANTTYIRLKLEAIGPPITAYFDDIQLIELPDDSLKNYDARNNYVTSATDPDGKTSYLTQDSVGNVIEARDARSASSSDNAFLFTYTYNELNQILSVLTPQVHDALGTDLGDYDANYAYDTAGRMTGFSDNRDQDTDFTYNALDKVSQKTDPKDRSSQVSYNEVGGVSSITYPNGWEAYFSYDVAGRLEKIACYDPSTQQIGTAFGFSYNSAGNLTGVTDQAGNQQFTYAYDKASRVTSSTDYYANGFTGTYTYTKEGKAKRTTYSKSVWGNNEYVEYSYGETGELTTVNLNGSRKFSYVYDDRGRLSTQYIPDAASSGNYSSTTFSYDAVGRPATVANSYQGEGLLVKYTYDAIGNITRAVTTAGNSVTKDDRYTYDELCRLVSWTDLSGKVTRYFYDGNGNLTQVKENSTVTETYEYDEANQITGPATGYSYDTNGNLTSDGVWTYTYDRGARLIKAESVSKDESIDFNYGSKGQRLKKKVSYLNSGALKYERFYHYDAAGNILCETDGSGTIIRSYVYDPAGHPIAFTQDIGAGFDTYYLHTNAHGDVLTITRSDGAWVKKYNYDPWGKLINIENRWSCYAALECPYTYAGYFYDKETSLYCMPARYYSPTLRRFLTKDPDPGKKANPLTLNPYQYCENNPVLKTDPSGKESNIGYLYLLYGICIAVANGNISLAQGQQLVRDVGRSATGHLAAGVRTGGNFIKIPLPPPRPSGPSTIDRITNCIWTMFNDVTGIVGGIAQYFPNPLVMLGGFCLSSISTVSGAGQLKFAYDHKFITKDEYEQMQFANGLTMTPWAGVWIKGASLPADFKTWFGFCPSDSVGE
jgi:RHS repeat-associated protein